MEQGKGLGEPVIAYLEPRRRRACDRQRSLIQPLPTFIEDTGFLATLCKCTIGKTAI